MEATSLLSGGADTFCLKKTISTKVLIRIKCPICKRAYSKRKPKTLVRNKRTKEGKNKGRDKKGRQEGRKKD
jgi:hypothetical protein